MDERIVPMNRVLWKFILQCFILPRRSKRNVARYEAIWTTEGSPFTLMHRSLTQKLQNALVDAGHHEMLVRCGMAYSDPDIYAALAEFKKAGCEKIIVLPLYPQSAFSVTAAVFDGVERALQKLNWDVACECIDNYHDNPAYIACIADTIRAAGFDVQSDDRLLFSFHSIPMNDIKAGDTFAEQTKKSCALIARELGIDAGSYLRGYQCRFDHGREWLKPYTSDVLSVVAQAQPKRLFYVCPNFAVDCLETLYDVEHEMKPQYLEFLKQEGIECVEGMFTYIPCLNDSDAHVAVLREVISSRIG